MKWRLTCPDLQDQAQPSLTNMGVDLSRSTPINNHARQLASENSCKSCPTLEIESRFVLLQYAIVFSWRTMDFRTR